MFENPADYDKIHPDDRVSLLGLADIAPAKVIPFLFRPLSYWLFWYSALYSWIYKFKLFSSTWTLRVGFTSDIYGLDFDY